MKTTVITKKIEWGPLGPPVRYFFIIHPMKKMLDENYVDFDFRIAHVLVFFQFLQIINEKCRINHVRRSTHLLKYISIYIGPNALFSLNLIYHDFLPTPGGVVMSSQIKHTHSHQNAPLSPYT